jgi:hypothetical protein
MKNKINVLSVRVFGIIALFAVIILSATSCFGKSFNNADALKKYLDSQPAPANSPDKPIKITIKVNDSTFQNIADVIGPAGKYVSIKLSGNALTTIGNFHDGGSKMLVSIIIPKNVTSIWDEFLNDCPNLKAINVNSSNKFYSSNQGVLFVKSKDNTKLMLFKYPQGKAGAYTIPDGVTNIGDRFNGAFLGCTRLTSVTIPDSVTSIGGRAFLGCTNLTSVTIGNGVTSIGNGAFSGCTSLTSVTIPDSVTSIGNGAFSGLKAINVNSSNKFYSSDQGVLYNKDKTTLVAFPGSKTEAFAIPDSVTIIGEGAFSGCTSLTSVTIPNSVTSIGNGAFSGCTSLASVTIPNSVTSIGSSAFSGCTSLISVTIPNSVTNIRERTFYDCTSLTSVTIPNSITIIERYAYYGCTSLARIIFQGKITPDNFSHYDSFHGDLSDKYLSRNGGIGTYTTTTPVPKRRWDWKPVWTKQ